MTLENRFADARTLLSEVGSPFACFRVIDRLGEGSTRR